MKRPGIFPITAALPECPCVTIVDAGAMDLGQTGALPWQPLVDAGLAQVIGFEPVEAECQRLNRMNLAHHRFLPFAIGDGATHRLYMTQFPACTSIFEPNWPFLELFQELAPLFDLRDTFDLTTQRLDDITELREAGCDYLKLDIQCAETAALQGGRAVLARTMMIQTEITLAPMYQGAPKPGELDNALRCLGFMPWRYLGYGGRTLKPLRAEGEPPEYLSQTLWGDAVYVRDYTRGDSFDASQWTKLAMLAHALYGATDLAHLALRCADALLGSDHAARYATLAAAQS